MNTENQERRKYKRYDDAFKRKAVARWLPGGQSVAPIARDLGIRRQSLKPWQKPLATLPATGRTGASFGSRRPIRQCRRPATPGVSPSMSRNGNGCANATRESFWRTLERGLHHHHFPTRAAAKAALFEWIEGVYNRGRFHSPLGDQSPMDLETHRN